MADLAPQTRRCLVDIGSDRYRALAILADRMEGDELTDAKLNLVEKRTRANELTLMSSWTVPRWSFPQGIHHLFYREFVNTIAPAACLTLGQETDGAIAVDPPSLVAHLKWPILVSSVESMRFVCAGLPETIRRGVEESERIRTDYSQFSALWSFGAFDTPNPGRPQSYFLPWERASRIRNIGEVMGGFHNGHLYLRDAHIDNFSGDGKIFFDIDGQHDWQLARAPSSAQCATMLVPLLMTFDRADYREFRASYISTRGAPGEDVHNCLEYGDLTGWMRYLAAKDYVEVYRTAHLQLSSTEATTDSALTQLRRALAIACSHLELTDEADENFTAALDVCSAEYQPLIHLNFASHLIRSGDTQQARKHLRTTVDLGVNVGAPAQVVDAARRNLLALG